MIPITAISREGRPEFSFAANRLKIRVIGSFTGYPEECVLSGMENAVGICLRGCSSVAKIAKGQCRGLNGGSMATSAADGTFILRLIESLPSGVKACIPCYDFLLKPVPGFSFLDGALGAGGNRRRGSRMGTVRKHFSERRTSGRALTSDAAKARLVSGLLEIGKTHRYCIDGCEFAIDANTLVIGEIRLGYHAKVCLEGMGSAARAKKIMITERPM